METKITIMRPLFTILFMLFSIGLIAQAQQQNSSFDGVFNQAAVFDMSPIGRDIDNSMTREAKRKLLEKQYLTIAYNPALIDQFKTTAFLRYNMYNDQMEFVKNDQIYYMKKELGRKVRFTTLNTTYKVYEVYSDLEFFLVKSEGPKGSLLVKQSVRFVKPEKATSQYTKSKEADFKRRKDEYFFAMGEKVVKIPTKKKSVPAIFGDNAIDIRAYMKKEKIKPNKLEDLKKLIDYFNTL